MTLTDAAVRAAVAEHWGLGDAVVTPHHGGMNSATWFVEHAGRRWVAKSVPAAAAADFAGGPARRRGASSRPASGRRAGAGPRRRGRWSPSAGRPLALLTWVPGRPLEADDQPMIGATLASVHQRLVVLTCLRRTGSIGSIRARRTWASGRGCEPAVTAAVEALDTGPMTWGLLHTDPAPEAFRLDGRACGLIDWSWAMSGPLLYDLASAVMYVGRTSTGPRP